MNSRLRIIWFQFDAEITFNFWLNRMEEYTNKFQIYLQIRIVFKFE